ncbi:hypothetical protein [Sporosarcina psychrophila]|uniref:hypothetical protein n=1 Tax=Sporosarcina psychrophila TaxID=1476 RepID=UPI00078E1F41|nr:hypothetical protein [Sporosarcina psychrophila]AMQ05564.1 hypothetical protein AZE41_06340 [Sporosarcina psychrophila]
MECVEVVEIVNDNKLQMQATKYAIQGLTFDWYFVFSQGQIVLNNENIKAINIAGFWIQINKLEVKLDDEGVGYDLYNTS